MKQVLPNLKLNDKVWATVEEILVQNDILVNFQGDLMRVNNVSGRRFRPGQRIQLKVSSVHPLSFQLLENRSSGMPYSRYIDIDV
jgi:hypothetical protein